MGECTSDFHTVALYGGCVHSKVSSGNYEIFSLKNESGWGEISVYPVFPGIELVYNDIRMDYCNRLQKPVSKVIEINYCRQGRYECVFNNHTYCYAEPGDLSVSALTSEKRDSCFPSGYYQGITVTIDLERITDEIKTMMRLLSIDLESIEALIKDREYYIVRASAAAEHIFSELYTVREHIRQGYIRLRVLELLLALTDLEVGTEPKDRPYFSKEQRDCVRRIRDFMIENIREHYTLEELAKRFDISLTSMKVCFRGVYGISIYAYLRSYRLWLAERFLKEGRASVSEIACQIGYENPNKFTSAFKKAYGLTPTEFRKKFRTEDMKN